MEPYIDIELCTSCDDCIKLNKQMFAYNENKQAYIADASAGTFKQLVMAAEACPAEIIHPGTPLDPARAEPRQARQARRAVQLSTVMRGISTFQSGMHPDDAKELTAASPIRRLPFPDEMVLPLQQHTGRAREIDGAHRRPRRARRS